MSAGSWLASTLPAHPTQAAGPGPLGAALGRGSGTSHCRAVSPSLPLSAIAVTTISYFNIILHIRL